jgi:hypothetical protein
VRKSSCAVLYLSIVARASEKKHEMMQHSNTLKGTSKVDGPTRGAVYYQEQEFIITSVVVLESGLEGMTRT